MEATKQEDKDFEDIVQFLKKKGFELGSFALNENIFNKGRLTVIIRLQD